MQTGTPRVVSRLTAVHILNDHEIATVAGAGWPFGSPDSMTYAGMSGNAEEYTADDCTVDG